MSVIQASRITLYAVLFILFLIINEVTGRIRSPELGTPGTRSQVSLQGLGWCPPAFLHLPLPYQLHLQSAWTNSKGCFRVFHFSSNFGPKFYFCCLSASDAGAQAVGPASSPLHSPPPSGPPSSRQGSPWILSP